MPLVLIPGASTAVVLRNSIAGGMRGGVMTAVGINAGSFCYGLLSALGFAAALRRWPSAWTVVHGAGVLYLAWLGLQSLRRAARPPALALVPEAAPPHAAWRNVSEGFFTNVLNPAIATFYLIVVPQFIPAREPIARSVLILTAVHIALAAAWHLAWAAAGGTLARVLATGWPRQVLEAVAGTALVGLALRIALG